MKRLVRAGLALAFVQCVAAASAAAQIPDTFKNLKVLPPDIAKKALIETMKGFAIGLGVRCPHCHVGEEGKDLSTFDFVSDEKPAKAAARLMLKMTMTANADFVSKLPPPSDGRAARGPVLCITCHNGKLKPVTELPARPAGPPAPPPAPSGGQ